MLLKTSCSVMWLLILFLPTFFFSAEVDKTHAVSALSAVIKYLEVSGGIKENSCIT